jgi:hypothetical protein
MVKASEEDFSNGIPGKCAHGHDVVATVDNLEIAPNGRNFRVICPDCGSIANIAAVNVAKMCGYDYGSASEVVKQHMEATGAKPVERAPKGAYSKKKSDTQTPNKLSDEELDSEYVTLGIPKPKSVAIERLGNLKAALLSGDDDIKAAVKELDTGSEDNFEYTDGDNNDKDDSENNEVNMADEDEVDQPRRPLFRPSAERRDKLVRPRQNEVPPTISFPDEDMTLNMSNNDALVHTVQMYSGLPPEELRQLVGLLRMRDGEWDALSADAYLRSYGITDGLRQNLIKNFKNKLTYRDGLRERAAKLTSGLKEDPMSYPRPPSQNLPLSQALQQPQFPQIAPATQQQPRPAYEDLGVNGPALQALLRQSGGLITPEVRAFMDKIYSDTGRGYPPQQSYGQPTNQDSIATLLAKNNEALLQQVNSIVNKREQEDADEKRFKLLEESFQKQLNQTNSMYTQTINALKESKVEHKDPWQEMAIKLLEQKTAAPAPAPVKEESMQDKILMALFDNMLGQSQNIGGSVAAAVESLRDDLKRNQNTLPGGLPMDPNLLNGYVEYQRAMGDIAKVQIEHADKRESRAAIKDVADGVVKTVADAVAIALSGGATPQQPSQQMHPRAPSQPPQQVQQNLPRAPEEMSYPQPPVEEAGPYPARSYICPGCGGRISAPAGNRYISCPICRTTADVNRTGDIAVMFSDALISQDAQSDNEDVLENVENTNNLTQSVDMVHNAEHITPTEDTPAEDMEINDVSTEDLALRNMSMDDITDMVNNQLSDDASKKP